LRHLVNREKIFEEHWGNFWRFTQVIGAESLELISGSFGRLPLQLPVKKLKYPDRTEINYATSD